MNENLPIISLELNSGVFKIRTGEAVYEITVKPDSSLAQVVEKVVVKETVSGPCAEPSSADPFFQELSEDMYREIGRLARQLSLSIKDMPSVDPSGISLESTGMQLEDAKGQLEDIVQMTEKATMDIMDLAESIVEDIQGVDKQLAVIKQLDFMTSAASEDDLDWGDEGVEESIDDSSESPPEPSSSPSVEVLASVIEMHEQLKSSIAGLPILDENATAAAPVEAAPPPEPVTQMVKEYQFDVDVVFQTMYELCTNEAVKDHIKAMRTEQDIAFTPNAVRKTLSDLAPTVDVEDNFFNFPIVEILKSLYQASNKDKYKAILKKMNQTAGSIFLDTVLPIEGVVEEKEVTIQPETPAEGPPTYAPPQPGLPAEKIQELLSPIEQSLELLNAEKERLETAQDEEPASQEVLRDGMTFIKKDDRQVIISSVEGASNVVSRIMDHITHIMEALSFQDLSGQQIRKISHLLSHVQFQLLSLLVSFGAKMKLRMGDKTAASKEEVEKLAQDEVDKMLDGISAPTIDVEGEAAEGPLDQEKVNNLLADLGF